MISNTGKGPRSGLMELSTQVTTTKGKSMVLGSSSGSMEAITTVNSKKTTLKAKVILFLINFTSLGEYRWADGRVYVGEWVAN
jgi:hypothetical protein